MKEFSAMKSDDIFSVKYEEPIGSGEYCEKCGEELYYVLKSNGDKSRLECVCAKNERKKLSDQKRKETKINTLLLNSGISPKYSHATFKNYVPDNDSEKGALRVSEKYAEKFVETFSSFSNNDKKGMGIYLYGTVGSGKTHLSCAIGNYLISNEISFLITSEYDIYQDYRSTINNAYYNESDVDRKYLKPELLVIDDMGMKSQTDFEKERLYNIINKRMNNYKPTILTSNLKLSELEMKYDSRIVDRIKGASYLIEITGNSHRIVS